MKKLISTILALTIIVTIFSFGSTASAATTTFNGKNAVKGEIVYATYAMQAPEVMEDIQAYAKFSSGLKLMSVSFSNKMKTGSFFYKIHSDRVNFNSVCIMEPMDFRKSTNIITMKFKVTGSGKLSTSFVLEVMDGVNGTHYGKNQTNSHYNKLKFQKKIKMMVYSVNLNKTSIKVKVGKTKQLYKTITPSSASKSVQWTSSNKKIATVTSNGKVKGIKKGTCYITCKAKDGSNKYKKCKVTVR
ncbi:MAG: Ig-like domain-containing protein [Ruminococcus sp.]